MDDVTVTMERVQGLEFLVKFDPGELTMDEPGPDSEGPNASRVLAAALGNCLSASLLFCLQKAKVDVRSLKTKSTAHLGRNEKGRLRVQKVTVEITIDGEEVAMKRCLGLFEDYCTVTASIRQGIPVDLHVRDPAGRSLRA